MSKVFKNGVGAQVAPLDLAGGTPPHGPEVRAYCFRRVDEPPSAGSPGREADPGQDPAPAPPAPPPVDVEGIRKSAYGQGYSEGEQAAADRAAKQFQSVMQSFRRTTEELAAYKPSLRREAEQELVKLALVIAQRIIRREVQVDRACVIGIVQACIGQINGAEIHRLRVNPEDAEVVSEYFRESGQADIEIVPDQSIAPGGAVLHTSQGQLDARLENQLREIECGLADR